MWIWGFGYEGRTLHSYGDGVAIVKKPVAVYVEKVYEEGDFAALGIGA